MISKRLAVLPLLGAIVAYAAMPKPIPHTILAGVKSAELADSPEEHMAGLSGRSNIPDGHAMVFVFEDEATRCFWGADMLFDTQATFYTAKGAAINEVILRAGSVEPQCSTGPAKYVKETNLN